MNIKDKFLSIFKYNNKSFIKDLLSKMNDETLNFELDNVISDYDLKEARKKSMSIKTLIFLNLEKPMQMFYIMLNLVFYSVYFYLFLLVLHF